MAEEKSMAEEKTTPIEPPAKKRRPLHIALALITFILGIAVGIPGKITNLQVQFDPGDQMTITGSYQYNVLSVPVTQNITIVLQPYADACNLQMHILKADYGSIPVTGFASIFEKQINDKLQQAIPSTVLKGSYALCLSSVNTQTGSIILAFSATPLPS